jgi:hypothetical protein
MKKARKSVRLVRRSPSEGGYPEQPERINPVEGIVIEDSVVGRDGPPGRPSENVSGAPGGRAIPVQPIYRDDAHDIWLYHGNCLTILDGIAAKHPDGCFDMVLPLDNQYLNVQSPYDLPVKINSAPLARKAVLLMESPPGLDLMYSSVMIISLLSGTLVTRMTAIAHATASKRNVNQTPSNSCRVEKNIAARAAKTRKSQSRTGNNTPFS